MQDKLLPSADAIGRGRSKSVQAVRWILASHERLHKQISERVRLTFPHLAPMLTASYLTGRIYTDLDDSAMFLAHTITYKVAVEMHLDGSDEFPKEIGEEIANICVIVASGRFKGGEIEFPDLGQVYK